MPPLTKYAITDAADEAEAFVKRWLADERVRSLIVDHQVSPDVLDAAMRRENYDSYDALNIAVGLLKTQPIYALVVKQTEETLHIPDFMAMAVVNRLQEHFQAARTRMLN